MLGATVSDKPTQSKSDELNTLLCRLYELSYSGDLKPMQKVTNQRPVMFDALVQPISQMTVLDEIHRIFADEIEPFLAHVRSLGYEGQFAYEGITGRIQMDFATALDAVRFKQAL